MRLSSVAIAFFIFGSSNVMADQPNLKPTRAELQAIRDKNLPEFRKMFPELQGSGTDEKKGVINLTVYGSPIPDASKKASSLAGVPVNVKFVSGKDEPASSKR
ncbi:hypothetical protein WAQ86_004760 [Salmonella enterica]